MKKSNLLIFLLVATGIYAQKGNERPHGGKTDYDNFCSRSQGPVSRYLYEKDSGQHALPDTQGGFFVRVHFLCGSKPKRKYKAQERQWFGGKLGGHAGVEIAPNYIIDFGPRGTFHIFSHDRNRHSGYTTHDTLNFYEIFGTRHDSVQRMIITIPITSRQKSTLDSLAREYLGHTPYDYAFFGMRCGAAAYDVLAQIGVVKKYTYKKTRRKIFYPRRLRRRLMKKAEQNHWKTSRQQGSSRRKWERE